MEQRLKEALDNPIWKAHTLPTKYTMDNKGVWRLVYYPIFENGKTGEEYGEPRALMERLDLPKGKADMRETPLRYIQEIEND